MTQEKMKAALCTAYGPPEVLQIAILERPIPKANEVLIRIKASSVNSGDVRVRGLDVDGFMRIVMRFVLGFTKPRKPILGTTLCGVIEKVGDKVKLFKPGDEVFGTSGFKFGAHAEYMALPENGTLDHKP
jgi:NADPH:quinone reductase-like Zn-dependent oxidoreductase